jgi:hypothetical protein
VYLADFFNEGGSIVGSDIVPGWIQFCQEQFPNATFYCLRANHPHYGDAIKETMGATPVMDEEGFFRRHRASFDMVVAFQCLHILIRQWQLITLISLDLRRSALAIFS